MSNRDSLGVGDLIPQDVVDIFAHEKHSRRSQKKRSHSLGRALGWLKGKKKREASAKRGSPGLGPALDLAVEVRPPGHHGGHKGGPRSGRQAHPQAVLKLQDDDKAPPPPLLQENVFVEASRPQYLENLHTEALEGLKMMQQEETNNGVEFKDNESTISNMTVQTDGEGSGFVTDSTIADTTSVVSVQSSVSTRSSRSGLTRQGSTFRPLNSGKKSEKGKTRRKHRKTVGGIPQHVQMELGLDRGGWTVTQRLDEEQLYNGETDESSATDGPPEAIESPTGPVGSPEYTGNIKPPGATHAGHRDDMALLQHWVPDLSDEHRPKSLAVPWMTTANSLQQKPPSPVMSMSPQAAYMSKIIPNAVLPPSIDVVEISRAKSRNSVRTVSKSSLVLSSPAPSRPSSRACSSRASTVNSISRYNPLVSDSSGWSNSDSSDTLVSDSSTISSGSTPRQKRSQDGDVTDKENKNTLHVVKSNGKVIIKVDDSKKDGPFARSLSVMKPKKAPPPPNRSYSLHNKMKRRSRDLAGLAEVAAIPTKPSTQSNPAEGNEKNKGGSSPMPSKIIDSPGYNADTSSLEDSSGSVSFSPIRSQLQAVKAGEAAKIEIINQKESEQANKLNKVMSPSSGYSSHDGTSALLSTHSPSPKQKRGFLAKIQRFFPGSTPAAPTPSPLTKPGTPEITKSKIDSNTSVDTASVSPSVRTLIELFNIPPHPKVRAPPPPPPEVWAHSKRSFELLLGPPAPDNVYAIIKKNPKDRRQQRKSPSTSADGSVKSLVVEKKYRNGAAHGLEAKKVQESVLLNAEIQKENSDRVAEQNVDLKGNSKVTEVDGKARVSDILNMMLVKAAEKREERLAVVRKEEDAAEVTSTMDRLPVISLVRNPPTPSPPPTHSPPYPPAKKSTGGSSVGSEQVVVSPEISWPPPPPPVGLGGADEFEFPLPPPPVFSDEALVLPVQVPPNKSVLDGDSSSTSTLKTDCLRVTKEAEPQTTVTSKESVPPLNIPPPPSYTAPPPPIKIASAPVAQNVSPPHKAFSLPPSKILFPSPTRVSPLPPLIEVSSPPPTEVSIPSLAKDLSPPPPAVVSISPPPKKVSPPPPALVSIPPPPVIEASPTPPAVVSIPPPPAIQVSPPPPTVVSIPPPPKEVPLPPPTEAPIPSSLPKDASPPPATAVSNPSQPEEISPPPPKEVSLVMAKEALPPQIQEVPLGKDISATQASTVSTEEVSPPSTEEKPPQTSEENTPVEKLPPPQLSVQEIILPNHKDVSESETNAVSSSSILAPPTSIPPPPPVDFSNQPQVADTPVVSESPVTEADSHSPASEVSTQPAPEKVPEAVPSPPVSNPAPSPLPTQSPASIENQTPELTPAPVAQEESTPLVSPSLLTMVKLRSVGSSLEPPKVEEQPQTEVVLRKQQPSNQVPSSSSSGEAPQKPIRKSLIITSPTSTSPPAVVASPTLPKSQSLVVPPVSTVTSPTKKSPPAMTATPSMNLQEAIRLRTAARSMGGPAPRLSLHSPTSPRDIHKSPSSTASFIFSKSNKKVVIETKPSAETNTSTQKSPEVSPTAKAVSETEAVQKEVKLPPPVAKKPKTKGKEAESSEKMEQTVGQEELPQGIMDDAEKTNGTAGTVEEGASAST